MDFFPVTRVNFHELKSFFNKFFKPFSFSVATLYQLDSKKWIWSSPFYFQIIILKNFSITRDMTIYVTHIITQFRRVFP